MTTYKRESLPDVVTPALDKAIAQLQSCNQYTRGCQAWPSLCTMLLTWDPFLLDHTDQDGTTAIFLLQLKVAGQI